MSFSVLLLSVKPKYAQEILDGRKRFELRKIRPRLAKGDWVILYVSSPVKALKAVFRVQGVLENKPKKLWNEVLDGAGISKQEYNSYFDGNSVAFAIQIKEVIKLEQPLALSDIRAIFPGFHPPQIYQYLNREDISSLFSSKVESLVFSSIMS